MDKIKVGLVFGGKSSEHEVSLQSANNIIGAINKEKYEVVLIGIDKNGKWHTYDESSYLLNADNPKDIKLNEFIENVALIPGIENNQVINASNADVLAQIDVVFPIVHGALGEDGSLQGLLRIANLPFVGSNVLSSAVCMDKDITKRLLSEAGIRVAKGFSFRKNEIKNINYKEIKESLGVPMFIKPANQGSSVGVSRVETVEEFNEAVTVAFQYDHKILIEENIQGREIECAVLGNAEPRASLPGEVLSETGFYSYESKYIDEKGAKLQIPAELSDNVVEQIKSIAVKVFTTLECEGLARVDVFLTDSGEIFVNEVNTLPGFTKISMYPKLWELSGIPYADLINQLIELGLERFERDSALKTVVFD